MNSTITKNQPAFNTILDQIKEESNRFLSLNSEVSKSIVGQQNIIQAILIAILSEGHILLEGVPGIAKTSMIKAIANALGLSFKRIQFTPDLLPADLIGTLIYNPRTQEFETKKGPIFAQLILADEINRAPAKVQSALLEAMQERQVTIGSHTYKLEEPFLVFATQNPLEQEGTYRLPEAQLDRFMFKLLVQYPSFTEEKEILKRNIQSDNSIPILHLDNIISSQKLVKDVYIDEKIIDYIMHIVFATRKPTEYKLRDLDSFIACGVSPRASIALRIASKAHAFIKQRNFVTPDDVKAVAAAILRHRLVLTYEAEAAQISADYIINTILNTIPAP